MVTTPYVPGYRVVCAVGIAVGPETFGPDSCLHEKSRGRENQRVYSRAGGERGRREDGGLCQGANAVISFRLDSNDTGDYMNSSYTAETRVK